MDRKLLSKHETKAVNCNLNQSFVSRVVIRSSGKWYTNELAKHKTFFLHKVDIITILFVYLFIYSTISSKTP